MEYGRVRAKHPSLGLCFSCGKFTYPEMVVRYDKGSILITGIRFKLCLVTSLIRNAGQGRVKAPHPSIGYGLSCIKVRSPIRNVGQGRVRTGIKF